MIGHDGQEAILAVESKNSRKKRITSVLVETLELDLDGEAIGDATDIDQLFGLDSVAIIEFVLGIEKEFGVRIESHQLERKLITNLDKLSVYIGELIDKSR